MKGKAFNIIIAIIVMPLIIILVVIYLLIYTLYSPFERRNFKKSFYPAEYSLYITHTVDYKIHKILSNNNINFSRIEDSLSTYYLIGTGPQIVIVAGDWELYSDERTQKWIFKLSDKDSTYEYDLFDELSKVCGVLKTDISNAYICFEKAYLTANNAQELKSDSRFINIKYLDIFLNKLTLDENQLPFTSINSIKNIMSDDNKSCIDIRKVRNAYTYDIYIKAEDDYSDKSYWEPLRSQSISYFDTPEKALASAKRELKSVEANMFRQ